MNAKAIKWTIRLGLVALLASGALLVIGARTGEGYIAHEWGTFTSVQAADGRLLEWHPLASSRLPKFVHDWQHPGPGRRDTSGIAWGKSGVRCLQRMETPVIYFYADREQRVDVSVRFPKGLITEWYPQADRIGPSMVIPSPLVAQLDGYAQKAGAKPDFTLAAFFRNHADKESRAQWTHLGIMRKRPGAEPSWLPSDALGSHYFAARQTDANCLQVDSLGGTNVSEYEKFIFYRGVGNFGTPLRVIAAAGNSVTMINTSQEPLVHLFVLAVEKGTGKFVAVDRLAPGQERKVEIETRNSPLGLGSLSNRLANQMREALVEEGLYRREAAAMVSTWKDSWFEQDGLRVLYLLPRPWTDRILPLSLDPAPKQLVRVMVGRSEILSDTLEQRLSLALSSAERGDGAAKAEAEAEFSRLGRFGEPALALATRRASPQVNQLAWELLRQATAQNR